jgi:hypothetical protein
VEAQNRYAGQGAVVLDIGGDVGALIVEMPADLAGVEIELRPVSAGSEPDHHHDHGGHDHHHDHGDDHDHALPHVAVVSRPTEAGPVPSLVFGEVLAGDYELYERLDGQVRLWVSVRGGEVTQTRWPDR